MDNSIKNHREACGMSRSTLADKMQVDCSTVWRWEEGKVEVSWTTLSQIAEILNVPTRELLPGLQANEDRAHA
jgi:DNA-binding XRE family transcriptional regulator